MAAAALAALAVVPSWTGAVRVDGVAVPLPAPAIPWGRGTWIVPGRRDLGAHLRRAAPGAGWQRTTQLGALHVLEGERARVDLVQQIVASLFTRVDARVSRRAPDPPAP